MMFEKVADITDLYRQCGEHMYDEEVSQITHAVQSARPQSADAIRLRRWDDFGKDIDNSPSSMDEFEQLMYLLVEKLDN